MDNQKIKNAIKEHSPKLMDKHTEKQIHDVLTGVQIISDVMVDVAHNAIDAINEMRKNPEFNQLVEASIKMNEVR